MWIEIITGVIVGVVLSSRFMFAPDSSIANVYFLGELGRFPILFIKLILVVLVLILFFITPNRNSRPF